MWGGGMDQLLRLECNLFVGTQEPDVGTVFHTCAVRCGSCQPQGAMEYLKCGQWNRRTVLVILFNLN